MTRRTLSALTASFLCFASLAAAAQPPQADLTGQWIGILIINDLRLHLAVNFSRQADAGMTGELISLDQNNARVPLANISVAGRAVHVSLPSIKGSYDAILDVDGNRMEGDWTQNGPPVGLSLERVNATPEAPAPHVFGPPLDARVLIAPVIFRAADQNYLAYELWLTNVGSDPIRIQKIEVVDGSQAIAIFEGSALDDVLQQRCGRNTDPGSMDAGCLSIARLWVALPSNHSFARLHHRILVDGQSLDAAPVKISARQAPVLGPPLRGGRWKALNGPGIGSGHWATLTASGGTGRFPDRFAIDWVKVGEDGKTFAGDPNDNTNYHAYGQPVLAVVDGAVASVVDGIPQNTPGSHAVKITPQNVCGNSVSVRIGEGQYAFYCHMQAGSLRVQAGQHLRKGEVIGLVGNSGDSSEPHLHFQISDSNSIAGSESLPYMLTSFETVDPGSDSVQHHNELPLRDQRIQFPQ